MDLLVRGMIALFFCNTFAPAFVSARDAILPHGDPRLQKSDAADQDRREEIPKHRLKQQEQDENCRIDERGKEYQVVQRQINRPAKGFKAGEQQQMFVLAKTDVTALDKATPPPGT